jgi:hypothetical protein
MLNALRTIGISACILSLMISVPVLISADLRKAFHFVVYRNIARFWPPTSAFLGDSLTADCSWRWRFERNPLAVANLAAGGARIRDVAQGQVFWAKRLMARQLFVSVGLNDLLMDHAPLDQIVYDYDFLFRKIGTDHVVVVTLIPYVSDPSAGPAIRAANEAIRTLAQAWGHSVVDINVTLAAGEIRKSDMTTDGIHMTPLACALWIDAVKAEISRRV